MGIDGRAIEDHVYNPEAEKKSEVIVVDVLLSRERHVERKKVEGDDKYNLAVEVQFGLVNKYYEKFPDKDVEKDLELVDLNKKPGEFTGDKARDELLLAIYQLHNPKDYSYRWFRNDGDEPYDYANKSFEEIVGNLNKFGTEINLEKEKFPTYLSSDSPLFWQALGWPTRKTTESYLLIFPAEGMRRQRRWLEDGPDSNIQDFKTEFDPSTPALNERQKVLIKISWE